MEKPTSQKASDRSLPLLPQSAATPWSWLTFTWCEPLVHRVRKTGSLECADLYDLGPRHSAAALAQSFLAFHARFHREAVAHNASFYENRWLGCLTLGLLGRRRSERQVMRAGMYTMRDQWLGQLCYSPYFAACSVATPLLSRTLVRYCRPVRLPLRQD